MLFFFFRFGYVCLPSHVAVRLLLACPKKLGSVVEIHLIWYIDGFWWVNPNQKSAFHWSFTGGPLPAINGVITTINGFTNGFPWGYFTPTSGVMGTLPNYTFVFGAHIVGIIIDAKTYGTQTNSVRCKMFRCRRLKASWYWPVWMWSMGHPVWTLGRFVKGEWRWLKP